MAKLLFIGTLALDVIAKLDKPGNTVVGKLTAADFMAKAFADKVELDRLEVRPGGSAANAAIAAHALGSNCSLVSAVGGDLFGRHLVANMKGHGIAVNGVAVMAGQKTSTSVILLSDGNKAVLSSRGAFAHLGPKHLGEELVRKNEVIITTSLSSNDNFALFLKAVKLAHKDRKKIVFAPSMTMLKAQGKKFAKLHPHFDLAICNEAEAAYYTGEKTAEAAVRKLPGKVRVVTMAQKGAIAFAEGKILRIAAPPVKVVDTTGAGDSFTGAFVHEFYSHGSVRNALQTATAVAGLKLAHLGAHFTGTAKEVKAFRKAHGRQMLVKTAN
jgi:ribokinase